MGLRPPFVDHQYQSTSGQLMGARRPRVGGPRGTTPHWPDPLSKKLPGERPNLPFRPRTTVRPRLPLQGELNLRPLHGALHGDRAAEVVQLRLALLDRPLLGAADGKMSLKTTGKPKRAAAKKSRRVFG